MIPQCEVEAMLSGLRTEYPTLGWTGFESRDPGQFHIDSVVKAMGWIEETGLTPTNRAFKWGYSYGLKHVYESWTQKTQGERDYLANGDFIAAALLSGMRVMQQREDGPNAFVAVSRKAVGKIRKVIHA